MHHIWRLSGLDQASPCLLSCLIAPLPLMDSLSWNNIFLSREGWRTVESLPQEGGRESNEAKSKIARKREANDPIKPTRSPERTRPKYRLYILMNNLYLVVDTGARGKEVMDTKVKIDTIKQHLELHYHTECHI